MSLSSNVDDAEYRIQAKWPKLYFKTKCFYQIITKTVSKQPTEDLNMKLTDAYKAQEAIKRHESFFQLEISNLELSYRNDSRGELLKDQVNSQIKLHLFGRKVNEEPPYDS